MNLLAACSLLDHVRGCCLRLKHRALQVYVEHVVKLFFGNLFRALFAVQTDAVNKDVELAKMFSRRIDHLPGRRDRCGLECAGPCRLSFGLEGLRERASAFSVVSADG